MFLLFIYSYCGKIEPKDFQLERIYHDLHPFTSFFDLDHTLLDFDRAGRFGLTYLEEAGVASILNFKDHYIPMNRSMWEDLNHGLITKPERFARAFSSF